MNKLISNLHMCIKARKIVSGESLLFQIKNQKVFLVLLAKDMGLTSKKKIMDKCQTYQIPFYSPFHRQQLEEIFKKQIVAVGINDKNLAKKLIENIKEGSGVYEEKNETKS